MTASSPCALGMIETRKSMVLPRTRSRKRPSCGTRFSAMSSSAITLMREMIALCEPFEIGRLAGCRTPSMRYFTHHGVVLGLDVDVAGPPLDGGEDHRVDHPDDRAVIAGQPLDGEIFAGVLVLEDLDEVLGCVVEHPLRALALLEDRLDGGAGADHDPHRRAEQHRQLVDHRQIGRVGDDDDQHPAVAPVRHEAVAQHQVGGDAAEQFLIDPEQPHVEELEPVAVGQAAGVRLLGAAGVDRQRHEVLVGQGLGVEGAGGGRGLHVRLRPQRPITDDSWKMGRYSASTTPAMTTPMNSRSTGSISVTNRPTSVSTSSS